MLATAHVKQPIARVNRAWIDRLNVLAHGHVPPLVFLTLAPIGIFAPGLLGGEIFYGKDTVQFYYPLSEWFFGELKRGAFPLWIPHIFGGYPLFADGEIGMAHPLVILAGLLLPADAAFIWLRGLQFSLAAVLAYWLACVLGIGRFGAVIAGLAFAFSSFLVGHMQHDNILRSAVWLPALIALLELAQRESGPRRLRFLLLAGLVLGVQCLGLHAQPVLISLVAAAGWVLVGPLGALDRTDGSTHREIGALRRWCSSVIRQTGADGSRELWRSTAWLLVGRVARLWMWALVVAVGVSVAAVQLVPLLVLSGLSMRGSGVDYYVSTSYAVSPPEMLTLLLPFFFRAGPDQHWSLWPPQETTIYFGIMPLMLAAIAIVSVRQRLVLWLTLGALVHLWLALGDYVTPNPYYWLWSLPGFSVMRAPARFSLVMALAVACLAGIGADWLARHYRANTELASRHRVPGLVAAWIASVLVLVGVGVALRIALASSPSEVMSAINLSYLGFRRELSGLGSPSVFSGLATALDLGNPSTRLSLAWMVVAPCILLAWVRLRRWAVIWRALTVTVVAADLLNFAGAFYPQARAAELRARHPIVDELVARAGPHHVLLDPGLYNLVGANQLVPYGVSVAGGYSSLEPSRFIDYWWGMVRDENVLLDMFNVRYVAAPRRLLGSLLFNETRFHPAERLVNGTAQNPAGSETFRGSGVPANTVTVVSAVQGLGPDWTGVEVGEIVLLGGNGEQRRFGLRYGMELTEYRAGSPAPSNARAAYVGPAFVPNGRSFPSELHGAVLSVNPPMSVDRVLVRYTASSGTLLLHGLGLRDATTSVTRSLTSNDRLKYTLVFEGEDAVLLENRQALPKVFFASGAAPTTVDRPSVADLVATPRDVLSTLVVDRTGDETTLTTTTNNQARTALLRYDSDGLSASVSTTSDGFLVVGDRFDAGWRAWVDGAEAPVLRANVVLRGVPVPAGDHVVELRYAPWWVAVGALVSGIALLTLIAAVMLLRRAERPATIRVS